MGCLLQGSHYRLGWEEKRKAGGSLVAPDAEHHYSLPEGVQYENGKGLSMPSSASGVDGLAVPSPAASGAPGGAADRLSSEAPR